MNIYVAFVVILVTSGAAFWGGNRFHRWVIRPQRALLRETPFPVELPRAGFLPVSEYGPFPVDTGPLLILSESDAANAALELEIHQRCEQAEAQIPPRWR